MAGVLFEDIFDVKDIDPEGKKFDRDSLSSAPRTTFVDVGAAFLRHPYVILISLNEIQIVNEYGSQSDVAMTSNLLPHSFKMGENTIVKAALLNELLDSDDDAEEILLLLACKWLPKPRIFVPHFDFDALPDDDSFIENFRFSKNDVFAFATELGLPETVRCQQRTTAHMLEALCIFL